MRRADAVLIGAPPSSGVTRQARCATSWWCYDRSAADTTRDVATRRTRLSSGLVARQLGLVERHFLQERLGDARPGLQKFSVAFDGRPRRQIDVQRHRPIQDGVEIRVGDGESIEQVLAAGKVVVEILQP